ncbi:hypothetical protein PFICI_00768 [Pestalotiopsis fici W106-1]|uniref:Major facilitator superfamily (MFS) profile domain-containing protein n=1 Tax=Pestalotiopsis fici (strain W106-1 / CGMCC3.15140) TaxID=1229662 RepID=W3XLT7_PESFW|nr:uncharacterized protein PFICI_00768 [Pestalotiopsis fici W106-1]ETS86940.1 hypothetical protein PFICI_00768 [Pestalotiopsis fici W106-1]
MKPSQVVVGDDHLKVFKLDDPNTIDLIQRAKESDTYDRNLTIRQALKKYKVAVFWAMYMSMALVMEGFDANMLGCKMSSFYGRTQFLERFGEYEHSTGRRYISAAWQSGLSNASAVGQLFGLAINAYSQDRFGARSTIMVFMIWMAAGIFIPVFTPSLIVLAIGEFMCGVPWGVFQTLSTTYACELVPAMLRPFVTAWVYWNWGAKAAWFFAGTNLICSIWCWFRLPETKDRTFGEIDLLFDKKVPARKWRTTRVDRVLEPRTIDETLENLHKHRCVDPELPDFSVAIIIHHIIQWNWQVERYYTNPLSQWNPKEYGHGSSKPRNYVSPTHYPAEIPQIADWRNSACDCLDVLHWNAVSDSAKTGDFEGSVFLYLHLARLVLLTPFMELRTLFESFKSGEASATQCFGHASRPKCEQIAWCWFDRDRYKCRLAVLHAGAIYWHIRRYPSDTMLQPFSMFMATVVLWAYALCCRAAASKGSPLAVSIPAEHSDVSRPIPGGLPGENVDPDEPSRAVCSPATPSIRNGPPFENRPREQRRSAEDSHNLASDDALESRSQLPNFMHIERPIDDDLVQNFIQSAEGIQVYIEGVGDLSCVDSMRVIREGARILKRRCGHWGTALKFLCVLESASR